MTRSFLLAALLAGCATDTHLDLLPDSGNTYAVGEGLEAVFRSVTRTCDPGDVYPAGCKMADAPISSIELHGPLELVEIHGNEFRVFGTSAGPARIVLDAVDLSETMDMPVLPIAYTRVHRRDDMFDWRVPELDPLPAFAGSSFEVWQEHYREPRATLERTSWMEHLDLRLNGYAPPKLSPGNTAAALVPIEDTYPFKRFPRVELATNDVLGTAQLTTAVGGTLVVDIVDETAIAAIELPDVDRLDNRYSDVLDNLVVRAKTTAGREIHGCTATGPTLTDTRDMLAVTQTSPCVFRLELAPDREWAPTTIVVSWGSATTELPFVP